MNKITYDIKDENFFIVYKDFLTNYIKKLASYKESL